MRQSLADKRRNQMAQVAGRRATIGAQVEIVGRQTKRTVCLVCVLHHQVVHVPEEARDELGGSDTHHKSMARLVRGRFDVGDVSHSRIWTSQPWNGRVEIVTMQQMNATLVLVIRRQPKQLELSSLQADRTLNNVWNL